MSQEINEYLRIVKQIRENKKQQASLLQEENDLKEKLKKVHAESLQRCTKELPLGTPVKVYSIKYWNSNGVKIIDGQTGIGNVTRLPCIVCNIPGGGFPFDQGYERGFFLDRDLVLQSLKSNAEELIEFVEKRKTTDPRQIRAKETRIRNLRMALEKATNMLSDQRNV